MRTIRAALIIVFLAALAVFAFAIVRTFFYFPDEEIGAPPGVEAASAETPQKPSRLLIPSIGVDTDVQHVGITAAGNMATPDNFEDVGWYKYGVQPGGHGSAVMAGHVNNGLGLAGVFERLSELKSGDDIYVEGEDGSVTHFIVTGIRSYPYDDVPTEVIFNKSGSIRLNLITCEGRWLAEDKTYDERLVVFAALADDA